MLSYREATTGAKPLDWNALLREAEQRPKNMMLRGRLRKLSAEWAHCATGQLSSEVERYPCGMPCDHQLAVLGHLFHEQVDLPDYAAAREVLAEIQLYATTLTPAHAVA